MQANPFSISVFVLGILLVVIAFYAGRHRETNGSQLFSLFMAFITLYVLAYSMELASLDLSSMLIWSKVEYVGICFFPNIFLLFVFQYIGRNKWITWKNICLLFIIPVTLLIIKFTDETSHLVYSTTWVDMRGVIPLLGFTRGPFYILSVYSSIPVVIGVILLLRKRESTQTLYRRQATLILISVIPPLIIYVFYIIGYQPFPYLKYLDLNALSYPLWGLGIYWAAYRYRLFEIAPIARETLIEHLSDGVFVLDDQNRLVDANPMSLKMLGWDHPPIGQEACNIFLNWKELDVLCHANDGNDTIKTEVQYIVGGNRIYFDLDITPIKNKSQDVVGKLLVIHDITDLKRLEDKLMGLTLVDELTGLNNRRGFFVLADQFIQMVNRMNLRAALIFIDLDNMKIINDTYGHMEGDRALVDAAVLLRNCIRSSDILARYGGDEFIALVMETEKNGSEVMLARLVERFNEFNTRESRQYQISMSYGVAHYCSEKPALLEELIEKADRAMYVQKQTKKHSKKHTELVID